MLFADWFSLLDSQGSDLVRLRILSPTMMNCFFFFGTVLTSFRSFFIVSKKKDDFVEKCLKPKKLRQTNHLMVIRRKFLPDEFFVRKFTRVFNYLHDSNSIFRPAGIN